jgi:hypothetical protein
MGLDRVKQYRLLILDIEIDATAVVSFATELPGPGLAVVWRTTLAATTGRQAVKVLLPGNAKGRYAQVTVAPTGAMILYGVVLWGKTMGEASETSWTWAAGPVVPTPDDWTTVPLPIPPTPEEWEAVPLPIPPTSEEWQSVALPVPPTPEEWEAAPLPTPPTSEEWTAEALPIPPTADEYDWAEVPVDQ